MNEYLKNKKPEMVDLYNSLFITLKDRIPDLQEFATSVYIGLKCEGMNNLVEVWIQASQIKLITTEPSEEKNKIGNHLSESYNWSKTYAILLKRVIEIDKVVDAIVDVYKNSL